MNIYAKITSYMKRTILASIIVFFFLSLVNSGPAFSFKLSPDLKAEIDDKEFSVKVHPNDPQAHFELAITYAYSNRIEDGLNELKKVDKMDPKYAPKALKYYQRKAKLFPNEWKVRFRYAFALYFNETRKNNYKRLAIDEFKQVIKLDPKNVFAYGYIATIYGDLNEVEEAIDYAKKALEIDSDVAAIHLLLGAAYYKKGQAGLGLQETMEAMRLRALGY
jgi:tetratricopeptide (TPR) repeat protein